MQVAGLGGTTLPRLAFPQEDERLRFIELAEPRVSREVGLIRRKGASLSPAAQAMESFIIESLSAEE
ncbi:LysR substrate-binding domain-containing protein [Cobetia marina]